MRKGKDVLSMKRKNLETAQIMTNGALSMFTNAKEKLQAAIDFKRRNIEEIRETRESLQHTEEEFENGMKHDEHVLEKINMILGE